MEEGGPGHGQDHWAGEEWGREGGDKEGRAGRTEDRAASSQPRAAGVGRPTPPQPSTSAASPWCQYAAEEAAAYLAAAAGAALAAAFLATAGGIWRGRCLAGEVGREGDKGGGERRRLSEWRRLWGSGGWLGLMKEGRSGGGGGGAGWTRAEARNIGQDGPVGGRNSAKRGGGRWKGGGVGVPWRAAIGLAVVIGAPRLLSRRGMADGLGLRTLAWTWPGRRNQGAAVSGAGGGEEPWRTRKGEAQAPCRVGRCEAETVQLAVAERKTFPLGVWYWVQLGSGEIGPRGKAVPAQLGGACIPAPRWAVTLRVARGASSTGGGERVASPSQGEMRDCEWCSAGDGGRGGDGARLLLAEAFALADAPVVAERRRAGVEEQEGPGCAGLAHVYTAQGAVGVRRKRREKRRPGRSCRMRRAREVIGPGVKGWEARNGAADARTATDGTVGAGKAGAKKKGCETAQQARGLGSRLSDGGLSNARPNKIVQEPGRPSVRQQGSPGNGNGRRTRRGEVVEGRSCWVDSWTLEGVVLRRSARQLEWHDPPHDGIDGGTPPP